MKNLVSPTPRNCVRESEDEGLDVVQAVEFSSEGFDFGVDWFSGGIGGAVVEEVYYVRVLVECGGYGVE